MTKFKIQTLNDRGTGWEDWATFNDQDRAEHASRHPMLGGKCVRLLTTVETATAILPVVLWLRDARSDG